ncbi:ankyrin repeat domain-containing protein [Sungkyunkwania multivorans]|uniref:Ankyrin repeat domain-containing protein n=1 Tax=Sungkyunkwania multivorans TaxID=1173618 RepID=A0ABW3CXX6_9FLAO
MKNLYFLGLFLVTSLLFAQDKDVFDIARKGSVSELRSLHQIEQDIINTTNEAGYSPLTLACYYNNVEVASYLIAHAEDINGSSKMGTPLMAATYKGDVEIVRMLLKKGADPNISDPNGTTALIYATMFQNKEIVKMLIEADADIYHIDNKGKSAYDYAKMHDDKELITIFKTK